MKNHGAISIALEPGCKSAATGIDGGHNFTVKFNIGTGDAVTAKVEIPNDAPGASDVRKLIGRGSCSFFCAPNDHQVFRFRGKPVDHTPQIQE
jgi:hypothetical protein